MNASNRIKWLIHQCRGSGSTTEGIKAALACGGVYVVDSFVYADQLKKAHPGLNVLCILQLHKGMLGIRVPIFFDTTAVSALIAACDKLEDKCASLNDRLTKLTGCGMVLPQS